MRVAEGSRIVAVARAEKEEEAVEEEASADEAELNPEGLSSEIEAENTPDTNDEI